MPGTFKDPSMSKGGSKKKKIDIKKGSFPKKAKYGQEGLKKGSFPKKKKIGKK